MVTIPGGLWRFDQIQSAFDPVQPFAHALEPRLQRSVCLGIEGLVATKAGDRHLNPKQSLALVVQPLGQLGDVTADRPQKVQYEVRLIAHAPT